jgi:hypothetical protein
MGVIVTIRLHPSPLTVDRSNNRDPQEESTIMKPGTSIKSARLTLNPEKQNLEMVHRIVSGIIGRSGCLTCGRLINIDLQFQGDPDPDLVHQGVISAQMEGF